MWIVGGPSGTSLWQRDSPGVISALGLGSTGSSPPIIGEVSARGGSRSLDQLADYVACPGCDLLPQCARDGSRLWCSPARPTAQYRRGRLAAEQACDYRNPALPNPGRQERDPARSASHRRHAATPSRRRHLDDRAVVGPRIGSVHPGLPPHRPCAQGTGAGPNHAGEPPPVATAHPTSCSPSSKPSNSRWSTPRPSPPRCRPPADQSRRA